MKLVRSIFLILFILAVGCRFSRFLGYEKLDSGLYLKLIEMGEGVNKPSKEGYVSVHISYKTLDDSIFYEGYPKFRLHHDARIDLFVYGLSQLSEGDSASMIISTAQFFTKTILKEIPDFLLNENFIQLDLRILSVQSSEDFEKEKAMFLGWVRDFKASEFDHIQQYLKNNKLNIQPESNGIYFLSRQPGKGPVVAKGKTVKIHYEGMFLNGKFVDSSRRRNSPLEFMYGDQMMLIEGLDFALGQMREGGKALVLIPSDMGFGDEGAAGGIVPPYTALIYELEVLEVK